MLRSNMKVALAGGALVVAPLITIAVSRSASAGDFFQAEQAGDSYVALSGSSTETHGGSLDRVERNGHHTVVSNFADPNQGPLGASPGDVQVAADGVPVVLDSTAGTGGLAAIFRVNPVTGFRTLVSDIGDASQGPLIYDPSDFSIDAAGEYLLVGQSTSTATVRLFVYSVNPFDGHRKLIADFSDASLGPVGVNLERVAAIPGDQEHLLVSDHDFGPNSNGALFRVNRRTGRRVVVSDFGNAAQGPLALSPEVFVFAPGHQIIITDENGAKAQLFRLDYETGNRTLISQFFDPSQGPVLTEIEGIAREDNGDILVTAPAADLDDTDSDVEDAGDAGGGGEAESDGHGALYRVNPVTGHRTLVTDFGNKAEGPIGDGPPEDVAVRPSPALGLFEAFGRHE